MKTNYSKICTRKNTAMLLVGFLTPVVLFTSLTVSMFNSGDSKAAVKTTQKYAVEKVYLTDELSAAPKAYFYDKDGNGWIIQCEQNGKIHLLDGRNGSLVDTCELKAQIEASPAAYDDIMVIGTTGKGTSYVYGIRIETGVGLEEEAGNEEDSGGA